jgi:2-dehydro-3-deoxyphosphogluconate aldolase/(4S)-4-hydroxy-2-oxoglutarate aldolase
MTQLEERIGRIGVVSLMMVKESDEALYVAEALMRAEMSALEITFRTAGAAAAISALVRRVPDAVVGAGTVLTIDNLIAARDAGAQFVVTPGLNPKIVEKAMEIGMPIYPGVLTPSEVEQGMSYGMQLLKFFPAEVGGGVPMLKAMSGPYQHTGIQFIPTGGVTSANLADYLSLPVVLACGGTWMASAERVAARDWLSIEKAARETARIVATVRTRT